MSTHAYNYNRRNIYVRDPDQYALFQRLIEEGTIPARSVSDRIEQLIAEDVASVMEPGDHPTGILVSEPDNIQTTARLVAIRRVIEALETLEKH